MGISDQTRTLISAGDQAGTFMHDTLLQRMGELRTTDYSQAAHDWQTWVRGYAWQARVNTNSGVNYKSKVYGADIGTDKTWQVANGRFATGAFVGFSTDNRTVSDNTGKTDPSTLYGGLYGTWFTPRGLYIDAMAKVGYLDTDLHVNDIGSHGSFNNWGILGSLEGGWQLKNKDGWFIEPQAQVTAVHFTSAGYDMDGTHVDQDTSNSYDLRGGLVAGRSIATADGGHLQPYVKAMVGQTWTNGGEVRVGGDSFETDSAGSRYELGGGLIWQISGRQQLYVDYTYVNGQQIEAPWRVNFGYRVVW
jgi:outer membrane autotransporter protein